MGPPPRGGPAGNQSALGAMVYGLRRAFAVGTRDLERQREADAGEPGRETVLIISHDVVGAALVGALVETLGYRVQFMVPPETADAAMRRIRPAVAMVDCENPGLLTPELIGRARMRGVSVLMFGSRAAVQRMQQLASDYDLHAVIMPATAGHLEDRIQKAIG